MWSTVKNKTSLEFSVFSDLDLFDLRSRLLLEHGIFHPWPEVFGRGTILTKATTNRSWDGFRSHVLHHVLSPRNWSAKVRNNLWCWCKLFFISWLAPEMNQGIFGMNDLLGRASICGTPSLWRSMDSSLALLLWSRNLGSMGWVLWFFKLRNPKNKVSIVHVQSRPGNDLQSFWRSFKSIWSCVFSFFTVGFLGGFGLPPLPFPLLGVGSESLSSATCASRVSEIAFLASPSTRPFPEILVAAKVLSIPQGICWEDRKGLMRHNINGV